MTDDTLEPPALRERLARATVRIREGASISTAMDESGLVTPVASRMLKVGEKSGDMAGMMKKAQEMQSKMGEMQENLSSITVTGESGAGLVKATVTANNALHSS